MPKNYKLSIFKEDEVEDLKFDNLADAKKAFWESYEEVVQFYAENPDGQLTNVMFGMLDKYHMQLMMDKHFNHHFEQFGLL